MSIAVQSIGEGPVSAQATGTGSAATKPPRTRQIVAKADAVALPEAR